MAVSSAFSPACPKGDARFVHQGQRFDQIHVQAELGGDGAGDLSDFNGVGEAIAEVVGITAGEDLGLGFQPAKCAGMDDAVAIALKIIAVRMRGLGITASAGLFHRAPRSRRAWGSLAAVTRNRARAQLLD